MTTEEDKEEERKEMIRGPSSIDDTRTLEDVARFMFVSLTHAHKERFF